MLCHSMLYYDMLCYVFCIIITIYQESLRWMGSPSDSNNYHNNNNNNDNDNDNMMGGTQQSHPVLPIWAGE